MLRWMVLPGALAGLSLHAYTCFLVPDGGPDAFTTGLFALSILPYLACLAAGMKGSCGPLMATCAIVPVLLLDILAFHEALVAPTTSTSAWVLMIVPVVNLLVVLLGFLVGWIACSLRRRKAAEKAP